MTRVGKRLCRAIVFAALLVLVVDHVSAAEALKVTPKTGKIEFVGSKPDGQHKGGFKEFTGTVKLDTENPEASEVTLEIDTTSLWSDNPKLTGHLKNADFFHVGEFPKAVFKSTGIRDPKPKERKIKGNEKITHILSGKLKILGVTKAIELPVTIGLDEKSLSVEGKYGLDRTRFGMTYGKGKIDDVAKVTFSLEIPRGQEKE